MTRKLAPGEYGAADGSTARPARRPADIVDYASALARQGRPALFAPERLRASQHVEVGAPARLRR